MPHRLKALKRMLTAQRYTHPHRRVTVEVKNLDARALAGWIYWKLEQRQLGAVAPGDVRQIRVLGESNSIVIIGEPAAVARLRALIAELDHNAEGTITVSCIPVETSQAQRLLCRPRPSLLVEMPDGTQVDPAAEEVSVERLCPVEPEYADELVVVVNPFVDPAEVERMVAEGVARIGDQPRLIERKGIAGTVTFQCEHTMPSGKSGLRLAALVGENGLMTVQVSIRCSGVDLSDPLYGGRSATVQYVAWPGQTVAVGVLPATGCRGPMTVLLLTADTVEARNAARPHSLARRMFERLRARRRDIAPTPVSAASFAPRS
ncbi:MAG: hypothetical protein J7M38_01935 [Armatimonadetes bacterium]|nr:hypothetical protein [Armatimonadota bacterium]